VDKPQNRQRQEKHARKPLVEASSRNRHTRHSAGGSRLSAEVIQHLAALDGVNLEISIEITAVKHDGFPDDKMRIVSENARTLKFAESDFEDK
jgi:hypothetical protein